MKLHNVNYNNFIIDDILDIAKDYHKQKKNKKPKMKKCAVGTLVPRDSSLKTESRIDYDNKDVYLPTFLHKSNTGKCTEDKKSEKSMLVIN